MGTLLVRAAVDELLDGSDLFSVGETLDVLEVSLYLVDEGVVL